MQLSDKQKEFALYTAKLITYIFSQGYTCTLGEALRTPEQAMIYAKNGKGILNSLHCKRLAIDLNLFSPEGKYLEDTASYEKFGVYWEKLNSENRWGGRFPKPDGNHFERKE